MFRAGETIRILLAEDSPADAFLAQREIKKVLDSCVFHQVDTREDFLAALAAFSPDLIISDYRMPQFDGLTALKLSLEFAPYTPVIIVTGAINEDTAVECMKAGAADYVIKEHVKRLGQAVLHALEEKQVRTARHKAEEALRESEERYRTLVHTLPDAVVVVDTLGQITYASPAALRLFGFDLDEDTHGLNLLRWVDECDQERATTSFMDTVQIGGKKAEEYLLQKKDGKRFFAEVVGSCLKNGQGEVTEIIAIVRDISERKQAEDNLRASEIRYRTRTGELEALFSLSTSLRQAQTTQDMLPILINKVQRVVDTDAIAFLRFDEQERRFTLTFAAGLMKFQDGVWFSAEHGICSRVLRERRACSILDYGSEPERQEALPYTSKIGPAAFIPLQSEETLLGVLLAARARGSESKPFSPDDIRILTAMGEMTGNALQRAYLFEDVQQHLSRTKALHNIQLAVANSFDLQFTLNVALENALRETGIDTAAVLLFNSSTHELNYAASQGYEDAKVRAEVFQQRPYLAERTTQTLQSIFVPNLRIAQRVLPDISNIVRAGFVTYYSLPLLTKGKVKGVLEIFHRTQHAFSKEEISFLQALAGQVAVAIDNLSLFVDLQQTNLQLSQAYDATIDGLSRALDLRDKETEGHTRRVIDLTVKLAEAIGFDDAHLVHIRRGAYLHDMGKMGVPDAILLKPDKLSDEEWEIMRRHPQYAYEMLYPIEYLRPALEIPYCHHEKWDGTGYPRGLKGEEIPLAARLFAIVDVWDAVTNERTYRQAWSKELALKYIREQSGKHFDPRIVDVFMKIVNDHH